MDGWIVSLLQLDLKGTRFLYVDSDVQMLSGEWTSLPQPLSTLTPSQIFDLVNIINP